MQWTAAPFNWRAHSHSFLSLLSLALWIVALLSPSCLETYSTMREREMANFPLTTQSTTHKHATFTVKVSLTVSFIHLIGVSKHLPARAPVRSTFSQLSVSLRHSMNAFLCVSARHIFVVSHFIFSVHFLVLLPCKTRHACALKSD